MGFSTKIRAHVHAKFDGHCAYCGVEISCRQMQVDHINPKYLGGTDAIDNLNPACFACNNYKLTYSIEELRREIAQQVKRARKHSVNFRLCERFGLIEITNAPVVFYFERVLKEDKSHD